VRHGTVEAAITQALEGISERDRVATKRVLERLAAHLEPAVTQEPTRRSRISQKRGAT
jgi:hypothetical protein